MAIFKFSIAIVNFKNTAVGQLGFKRKSNLQVQVAFRVGLSVILPKFRCNSLNHKLRRNGDF